MHRRARSILRGEQGLSMILVLCIGTLFVALSAALVYAASVLTANANRQLLEQEGIGIGDLDWTSWQPAFPTCWKGS